MCVLWGGGGGGGGGGAGGSDPHYLKPLLTDEEWGIFGGAGNISISGALHRTGVESCMCRIRQLGLSPGQREGERVRGRGSNDR